MAERSILKKSLIPVLALLIGLTSYPVSASRVRELGLANMALRAGRIFAGRCVGRTAGPSTPGAVAFTTYTFEVTEAIKGVSGETVSFRVAGTPDRPLFPDMATFEIGEEALVLLYPESKLGLSGVMGLYQGRLRIVPDRDGTQRAVGILAPARLLRDVPRELLDARGLGAQDAQPPALEPLLEVLRVLVREDRP